VNLKVALRRQLHSFGNFEVRRSGRLEITHPRFDCHKLVCQNLFLIEELSYLFFYLLANKLLVFFYFLCLCVFFLLNYFPLENAFVVSAYRNQIVFVICKPYVCHVTRMPNELIERTLLKIGKSEKLNQTKVVSSSKQLLTLASVH
jgi:hypothetical protein